MRIREVYIDGFGIFHDFRIVVPSGNQGVVLFTGANEAGKTTLMSFVRGVLFGFEGEASRCFYAPLRGGRHGGSLEVEMFDGRVERIQRYAERGQSRQPAPEVGNMSKALYANVFAFGLAELAALSSLGSDDVRSRIYSAGAGLGTRSLPEARRKLESKCESLYKPRGRTPLMNAALARADELDRRVADLDRDPAVHARLLREIGEYQVLQAQTKESLRKAREDQQWYASLDSTRLVWERLCQATAALERFGSEDCSCGGLLGQAGVIRELELKLDSYLGIAASIPGLQAEADAMRGDHRRLLGELGQGWDERAVAAFDTSPGVDETARQMRNAQEALAGAAERAQEALRARGEAAYEAMRQHDRLKQELERGRKPSYPNRAAIESRIEGIGRWQALLGSVSAAAARAEAAGQRAVDAAREAAERAEAASQARGRAQTWLAPALIGVGSVLAALHRPAWAALLIIVVGTAAGVAIARNSLSRARAAGATAEAARERSGEARAQEEQLAAAYRWAVEELEAAKAELSRTEQNEDAGTGAGADSQAATVDEAQLARQMERARQDLMDWDAFARAARDLGDAEGARERAAADLDTAREALEAARAALTSQRDKWRRWLSDRGIDPVFSHDGALQTIELIRRAKAARERVAQAAQRLEAALGRAGDYEDAVGLVLAVLEMPSAGEGKCQAAVDRLVKSSAEAQEQAEARKRVASEVQDLQAQLDSVFPASARARARADHSSHTAVEIRAALEEAAKRAEELEAKAGELDRKLGSLGQAKESLERRDELARAGAERASCVGELDAMLREWAAHRVCLDLLDQACEKYERERQPQVMQDASAALGQMTGGRWPSIIARVAGLESLDVVGPGGRAYPNARLSCGTEQQLYLAVRCGLVREYCSHAEPMPVMVDDVLVNFDPARSAAAARVLAELSDVCQVLVFTCHPHTAEHFRQTGLVAAEFALEAPGA